MNDPTSSAKGCTIELCENGPVLIKAEATLNGETIAAGAALCRCGKSSNKPYCDGTHSTIGFQDNGGVTTNGVSGTAEGDAALKIKTAPNGPILCSGPLTLRSADGATEMTGSRVALCRCGQSANKPYCDGTHSTVGFEAD